MSASEQMMQEQIDGIIGRAELRVAQHRIHADTHTGHEAKRAQGELALLLTGLAKLKTLRNGFAGL